MSNGLFSLSESDFSFVEGPKGKTLQVSIKGYSLVLYYSTSCEWCQSLIPQFKKLPGSVGGCTFAMVNISQNKGLVEKSKMTRSPIKYVPLIILHINGEPFMRYDGPPKFEEIKRFVIEIAQKVSQSKGINRQPRKVQVAAQAQSGPTIPAFTIGLPKNSGPKNDISYLGFDSAYRKPL